MRYCILFYIFSAFICCGHSKQGAVEWKSQYRNLNFRYDTPWHILPSLDTKEKTLTGVIDTKDGKSYTIQVTEDLSQEILSNKTYFEGAKKTMLQANSKNSLLQEDSTVFHGLMTRRQVYLMYTDKWGLLKQLTYVSRDSHEFTSIQILFPVEEQNVDMKIPTELLDFDKTVKINFK